MMTVDAGATTAPPPLAAIRVLELAAADSGAQLCGRLLADAGALVTIADPGPSGGVAHESYERLRRHGGKQALPIAPGDVVGLLERTDVLLLDFVWLQRLATVSLDPAGLQRAYPHLVVVALTPFGLSGPLAGRDASDLLLQAVTGITMTNGYEDEPPLQAGVPVPTMAGAVFGALAVAAALYEKRRSGRGELIDISLYDCAVCCQGTLLPTVFRTGQRPNRIGNRHMMTAPWNAYPTSDGWVVITTMGQTLWRKVVDLLGRPELATDLRFVDPEARVANVDELDELIAGWTRSHSTDEVLAGCAREDVPAGRIPSLPQALADPQVRSRPVVAAGPNGWVLPGRLAPGTDLGAVDGARPVARKGDDTNEAPLCGVRVLELGAFTAGPLAGRLLAALGADVLKVEPPKGENCRHLTEKVDGSGYLYYLNNTDKRGAVADLADADDRRRVQQLAGDADVVLTNLSAGVLAQAGLDATALRVDRPWLVYCAITGYGHTGPLAGRKAFDSVVQAHAGAMSLTGWPTGAPMKTAISWADVMGAVVAAFGVVCALYGRLNTGLGQTIDLALIDAVAWSTQRRWVESVVDGVEPGRLGNAHITDVPHGIYPCRDGWVSIHMGSDEHWPGLALLLGDDRADAGLTTAAQRREQSSLVDKAVTGWTSERSVAVAVAGLRSAGVMAEPVLDLPAVVAHPHTVARGILIEQHTPSGSRLTVLDTPWRFHRSPVGVRRPAPSLGQQELTW